MLAVAAAAGLLSGHGGGAPGSSARPAAAALVAIDLPRPAWFGMRLLNAAPSFTPAAPALDAPVVHARAGILVDIDRASILWQQDAHAELPGASTTKILTAVVALENFAPDERVTVTSSALQQAWDETRMGLSAGQTLTVQELLEGALLVSGNDAAMALAVDTVGLPRFVAAMNAQVTALGLHDSHFTGPVGLPGPAQYTSAYDLAAMSTAAIDRLPLFADIVALRAARLPATAGHPAYSLRSINRLLAIYPPAVGIKPGWTADAGYCEVGMAVREGHRLISVLLGAPYSFSQSRRLLDWGFVREGLTTTLPTPSPPAHG